MVTAGPGTSSNSIADCVSKLVAMATSLEGSRCDIPCWLSFNYRSPLCHLRHVAPETYLLTYQALPYAYQSWTFGEDCHGLLDFEIRGLFTRRPWLVCVLPCSLALWLLCHRGAVVCWLATESVHGVTLRALQQPQSQQHVSVASLCRSVCVRGCDGSAAVYDSVSCSVRLMYS